MRIKFTFSDICFRRMGGCARVSDGRRYRWSAHDVDRCHRALRYHVELHGKWKSAVYPRHRLAAVDQRFGNNRLDAGRHALGHSHRAGETRVLPALAHNEHGYDAGRLGRSRGRLHGPRRLFQQRGPCQNPGVRRQRRSRRRRLLERHGICESAHRMESPDFSTSPACQALTEPRPVGQRARRSSYESCGASTTWSGKWTRTSTAFLWTTPASRTCTASRSRTVEDPIDVDTPYGAAAQGYLAGAREQQPGASG